MHEAKTRLSQLVKAALEGEEVVLCRHGKPSVRLVPVPVEPANRNLDPDPALRPVFASGYEPDEPLSDEEWPNDLR